MAPTDQSTTRGQHLVAEYRGCSAAILDDVAEITELMKQAANAAGATIVETTFHRFAPGGVSGVVVIKESHLSIHTWPTQQYAAIDFYTCGDCDPQAAHAVLAKTLRATSGELMLLQRGGTTGPMSTQRATWSGSKKPVWR